MKIKYSIHLLFIIYIIFAACQSKDNKKSTPAGIIKPEVMVDIMVDIHLAESGIDHSGFHPDSLSQHYTDYYFAIFDKYKISKEKFIKSTDYYFENPARFEEIYLKVTEKLDQLNAENWN